MAYRRTYLRLRDKYYWPTMLKDVKEYCFACEPFALGRRVHGVKAFLNPLDLATKPFEVLGLDFLDPSLGNQSVLNFGWHKAAIMLKLSLLMSQNLK